MQRYCFFHAGCPDGFGAAWSAYRAWGDTGRYVARGHDDRFDPQRYEGATVAFVDIALPNPELVELCEVAARVIVLDHHVSARDRYVADPDAAVAVSTYGHLVHFDLEHSGAMLAWHHFHPDTPPPPLLRYVEDQDLWNWKLPRSEEVNAAIGSYAQRFEVWDELASRDAESLADEGTHVVRSNRAEIARALQSAHSIDLAGARAEAVNSRYLRAPIGHALAERAAHGRPWGAVYRISGERVDVSVYSIGDLDVASIASRYGGGGHRNAAGFAVRLDEWLRDFV